MRRRIRKGRVSAAVCILVAASAFPIFKIVTKQKEPEFPSAESIAEATTEPAFTQTPPEPQQETAEESVLSPEISELASGKMIQNVPHIPQSEEYPTGCESVAAVSLMRYYGEEITVESFIDQHLPIADYPSLGDDGILHGESPWEAFIGDPYSSSGYGCYSTAIVKALKSAVAHRFTIHSISRASLPMLCREYIDHGHPVMIWATMYMKEAYPGNAWQLPNGETFQFICPEHALLLIGYDEENYYFSDPLSEEAVTAYPKMACEKAYEALDSQAVVMLPIEKIS